MRALFIRRPLASGARKQRSRRVAWAAVVGVGVAAAGGTPATGQDLLDTADENSFLELSLEDLVNLTVTSASKEEERLAEAPAAIHVITQEDIRRSGHQSIPELLRMVPGMNVGRTHASGWAISARGFNGKFNNRMLVLRDGRSIYTTLFGGVYWDTVDYPLEDLERIEAIRGPGGTLWGANAVNGVINITSKSAADTQGWLFSSTLGTEHTTDTTLRYGGSVGDSGHFRVYGNLDAHDDFANWDGADGADEWKKGQGGFRADWGDDRDTFTVMGDAYSAVFDTYANVIDVTVPLMWRQFTHDTETEGANLLARWQRRFDDDSTLMVQSYFDYWYRNPVIGEQQSQTFDIEAQYDFSLGDAHRVIVGGNYRTIVDEVKPTSFSTFDPESRRTHLVSVLAQDTWTLVPDRFRLIAGTKLEHNDDTGFEVQPSLRAVYTPNHDHAFWGAASRAIRTPSRSETDLSTIMAVLMPGLNAEVLGTGDPHAEELWAFEAGYRYTPSRTFFIDVAAFYNVYDDLIVPEAIPGSPDFMGFPVLTQFGNSGEATAYGAEAAATWQIASNWKLTGSYSLFLIEDPAMGSIHETLYPRHQAQVRSYVDLTEDLGWNTALYYVHDSKEAEGFASGRGHLRLDMGLTWQASQQLTVGLWGQNLLDPKHPEQYDYYSLPAEIERGAYLSLKYTF